MSHLLGFGKYLPQRRVGNDELAAQLGVHAAWIVQACGIEERRYAADDETVVDLGAAAALDCLVNTGVTPAEIGLVLAASGSPDVFCPGPASAIAARLGMGTTPAIDLPIASAGSIAGMVLADSLTGRFGKVLVVATEVMSRRIVREPEGKETAILFGDGAGACLLGSDGGVARIAATALHTDGERAGVISVRDGRFQMEGVAVIRQASTRLPEVIAEVLAMGGLEASTVGAVVVHQANLKLLERVAKTLKVDPARLFTNIQRYGNTSSASLLIAAAEWFEGLGTVAEPVVFAGFGAGLSWGALLALPSMG